MTVPVKLLPPMTIPIVLENGQINPIWWEFFYQFSRDSVTSLGEGQGIDISIADGLFLQIAIIIEIDFAHRFYFCRQPFASHFQLKA